MILRRSSYIKKSCLNDKDIEKLKAELTIQNNDENSARQVMKCYEEDEKYVKVPKHFGVSFASTKGLSIKDKQHEGCDIDVNFKGVLRDYQDAIIAAAIKHIEETEGGTLVLPCGMGKTICGLKLSCLLRKKTLILVHTQVLLDQWKDRIHEFVENASVGIIRQKTVDVENRTHVIAMMQTVYRKDFEPDVLKDFTLLIVDEAHHVCASMLSKCIDKVGTKLRLGLSATPYRKDGFHKFLFWSMGPICFEGKRDDVEKLLVRAISLDTPVKIHKTYRAGGEKSLNLAKMINDLCDNSARTEKVLAVIKEAALQQRKVIVLGDRRNFLKQMAETMGTESEISVGTLFGGASAKKSECQMEHALKSNVIFATYQFVSEGFDCPSLDTLVLATPRSDVVQCVGRIQRTCLGKQRPLVIDLVDTGVFYSQFNKRKHFYESISSEIVQMKYGEEYVERDQKMPGEAEPAFPFKKRKKC